MGDIEFGQVLQEGVARFSFRWRSKACAKLLTSIRTSLDLLNLWIGKISIWTALRSLPSVWICSPKRFSSCQVYCTSLGYNCSHKFGVEECGLGWSTNQLEVVAATHSSRRTLRTRFTKYLRPVDHQIFGSSSALSSFVAFWYIHFTTGRCQLTIARDFQLALYKVFMTTAEVGRENQPVWAAWSTGNSKACLCAPIFSYSQTVQKVLDV